MIIFQFLDECLKYIFFQLPRLKKNVVWGAGAKMEEWLLRTCDEKAQNRSSVALHALSYSMSQTLQNVIKTNKGECWLLKF